MLEVNGLVTGFDARRVLYGIDLSVHRGTVAVLLGLNGAGKSVALRTISGLQPAWEGTVRVGGVDVSALDTEDRVRAGLGHVLQTGGVSSGLTVDQNLRLGAATVRDRRRRARNTDRVLTFFPDLADLRTRLAGDLSGGQRAMLAVARALMSEPRVLLVDEPSAGLSPAMVAAAGTSLDALRREGVTLLIVEQNVGFALEIADDVFLLEKGRVIYHCAASRLDRDRVARGLGLDVLDPSDRTLV